MGLQSPLAVAGQSIPNRIVMPPIVVFWADETAFVTDRHIAHYARRADGGVGLIVVEATAVLPEGRLNDQQLGIWSDEFLPGLSRLAEVIHASGAKAFVQIHHAGLKSYKTITDDPVAPSEYDDGKIHARELEVGEIEAIRDAFVAAAVRSERAGFDGVELHGAHGYLLNQFASPRINLRTDRYGGDVSGRLLLTREIIDGIRSEVTRKFVVSCRMGCDDPDLETSVEVARELEAAGIDMLHVSSGMGNGSDTAGADIIEAMPEGFPHSWFVYGGIEIGKHVDVPVIAVNGIRTPEQARDILDRGVAFVAMARALLVDPDWPKKAEAGEVPITCLECKPRCHWFGDGEKCPRFEANWMPESTGL
jgi:NADPH2 dehydrogenase